VPTLLNSFISSEFRIPYKLFKIDKILHFEIKYFTKWKTDGVEVKTLN